MYIRMYYIIGTFTMLVLIYVATVYVCEKYYYILKFVSQWQGHPCVTPWLHKRNFVAKLFIKI